MTKTKFILDSGDPDEYREIAKLAKKEARSELWGGTTNPTLIAKKLTGKKFTQQEAFELQKQIVLEITEIVSGAVSAEVYADGETSAEEMAEQGREIATWHKRVYVKLPTTIEGFKARTILRKESIPINNTLVFSQEQIFAICLHERAVQKEFDPIENAWPAFISPFVGRLDDIGEDGMSLVENGMKMKEEHNFNLWMLEASVRSMQHLKKGTELESELITAPAKVFREWFNLSKAEKDAIDTKPPENLALKPYYEPPKELLEIESVEGFMDAIQSERLNIQHDLTDKGIVKFSEDWKAILE